MAGIQIYSSKKKSSKRPLWVVVIVLIVVVVAAVAGFGVRWWQQVQEDAKEAEQTAISNKVSTIQLKALSGDYDQAQKDIEEALARSDISVDEKYLMLMQQGTNYENKKEYDKGIASFKAALEVKAESPAAEGVARCAEGKRDKEMAITYYRMAIELIPKDSPVYEADKKGYEGLIEHLDERL